MITAEDVATWSQEEVRRVLGLLMSRLQRKQRAGRNIKMLASLCVGESAMLSQTASRSNLHHAQIAVREREGWPDAKWATRMTNQGLRVTRIR